jgi:large subunit ribosomal protein L19
MEFFKTIPQNAIHVRMILLIFAAQIGTKVMNSIVNSLSAEMIRTDLPDFKAGDRVTVFYKIKEGNKERIQQYQGDVIQRRNSGIDETFTVRKISNGVGVERIFPTNSPFIEKVEVNRRGKVRRARIFYLRTQIGKAARIKEKRS